MILKKWTILMTKTYLNEISVLLYIIVICIYNQCNHSVC